MLRVVPAIALANLIEVDVTVSDVKPATVPAFPVDLHRIEADSSVNLCTQAVSALDPSTGWPCSGASTP